MIPKRLVLVCLCLLQMLSGGRAAHAAASQTCVMCYDRVAGLPFLGRKCVVVDGKCSDYTLNPDRHTTCSDMCLASGGGGSCGGGYHSEHAFLDKAAILATFSADDSTSGDSTVVVTSSGAYVLVRPGLSPPDGEFALLPQATDLEGGGILIVQVLFPGGGRATYPPFAPVENAMGGMCPDSVDFSLVVTQLDSLTREILQERILPVRIADLHFVPSSYASRVSDPYVTQARAMDDFRPGPTPSDTLDFGYCQIIGDTKYAVLGEKWTWDHPAKGDPFEGWTSLDLTAQSGAFWRQMDATKWFAGGNVFPAPAINGVGFALCGADKSYADANLWLDGTGYGNGWVQTLTSPPYVYDGTGTVDLGFWYFNQTEPGHDYTSIYLVTDAGKVEISGGGWSGPIGIDAGTGVITPAYFAHSITNLEFGGGTAPRTFNIVIEFVSDSGGSDEDGSDTWYGAVGIDDVWIGPNVAGGPFTYEFEDGKSNGLDGWVAGVRPGVGSYMGVADVGDYIIQDPCACALSGKVMKMHDSSQSHPAGQHEMLCSPIIDRTSYPGYNQVMAEWDQYSDLPLENGVFYRPGWLYFPYGGTNAWSPRIGIETYYYSGGSASCTPNRNIGTDWGLPTDAEQVKFVYEIYASCGALAVGTCSGVTNFSPLIDNVRVRVTSRPAVPAISLTTGGKFQDSFGASALGILSTTDAGNSDVVYNLRRGTSDPPRLADTLVVAGAPPTSASDRWEAKLWFRLKRMGPGQAGNARFNTWRAAVAGAKGDFYSGANPNFAWGYMDSVEANVAPLVRTDQFCSRFREGDANYNWGGGGEFGDGNDILPDLAFTPGTQVEYFVTSNYLTTPTTYGYLPDTTGENYYEFEILPSYRTVGGTDKFPCLLYVDACDGRGNPTAQHIIEQGLNVVMNGAVPGDPIPDPTSWDRYDYGDASSNWNAPFYRVAGGNGGATIPQMLGYKLIVVNTGNLDVGCMEPRDWQGFQQWLEGAACDGNTARQGFIANGSLVSAIINNDYPAFLSGDLGATHVCRSYNELDCPAGETVNDTQFCTGLVQVPGSPFDPTIATDVGRNWCPGRQAYSVLGVTGTGIGNVDYAKLPLGGPQTQYAQVINERLVGNNYRSIIEDQSYDMMTTPDPGNPGPDGECIVIFNDGEWLSVVDAASNDLRREIRWALGVSDPATLGLCVNPCVEITGVPDQPGSSAAVTRLYQNHPNPFNPRTQVRFSLATDSDAKLVIYDVNGRRVRTLVDSALKAGMHEVVWDGTDDAGHAATSGVYWSQLQAGDYSSNKKMVILK